MHTSILILIEIRWSRDLAVPVCHACWLCRNSLGGCSPSIAHFFRLSTSRFINILLPVCRASRCMASIQCWKISNQIHTEHKHTRSSDCARFAWLGLASLSTRFAWHLNKCTWIQHCDLSISSFAISFVIYLNFFALWIFCVIHFNECANRYINALCSIAWKISIFPPCVSTRNRRKEIVLPHSAVQCGVKLLKIGCNLIHDKINSIIFYSMRSPICSKTNWCWTRPNGEWWLLLRWALLIKHS